MGGIMSVIAIAGIKRSGSTLLYNAVRLALEADGQEPNIYGETQKPPYEQPAIIKIHRFKKDIAKECNHVFISNRGYNEVKASLERFNGEDQGWERIVLFYKWLQRWSLYSTPAHYFEYPELTEDLISCVERIAEILDLDIDCAEVAYKAEHLKPPEQGQDHKTLLFANHITQ